MQTAITTSKLIKMKETGEKIKTVLKNGNKFKIIQ